MLSNQTRVIEIIIAAQNNTRAAVAEAAGELEGLRSTMLSVGKGMTTVGAGMMLVGGALGAGIVAVASEAAQYQQAMTALVTGAGESQQALGAVSEGVLEMAQRVGDSPIKLAQGLYMIESAGFHGADGLKVLEASAEGAKIGMADQAVVADALTTVLTDYHLSADDAKGVTGQMTATVAAGKMHWQDFAASLSKVLPIAAGLHIPFQDVAAAEAVMTAHGVDAARAATAIQAGLMQLVHPSSTAQKAIKDLGIPLDVLQAKLSSGNLPGALEMFANAMEAKLPESARRVIAAAQKEIADGMDPSKVFPELEQRIGPQYAKMISDIVGAFGGVRGGALALNLLPNMAEYKADVASIGTVAQGAAKGQAAWNAVSQTSAQLFDVLKASVKVLTIRIAEAFLPALNRIMVTVTPLIQQFSQFAKTHGDLIAKVALGVTAFLLLGGAFLTIAGVVTMLVAVLNPVSLVIAAIVLAVGALGLAWATNFGGIRTTVTPLLQQLVATFQTQVIPAIGKVVAFVQANWPTVQTVISTVLNLVRDVIRNDVAFVTGFWQAHGDQILTTAQNVWNTIQTVISTVLGFLTPFINQEVGQITDWFNQNMPLIQQTVTVVWNAIQTVTAATWSNISTGIGFTLQVIAAVVGVVTAIIQSLWARFGNTLIAYATTAWKILTTLIDAGIHVALDVITLVMQLITGNWSGAWNTIQDIVNTNWEAIKTVVGLAINFLYDSIISPLLDDISSAWASSWNGINDTLTGVWNGIVATVKGGVNSVIRDLNGLIGAYDAIRLSIPGFSVSIPSIAVPGVGTVGGGSLSWPGFSEGVAQVGKIPTLDAGGIVMGPTLAALAVNRVPEVVAPLRDLRQALGIGGIGGGTSGRGDTYIFHLSGIGSLNDRDAERWAEKLAVVFKRKLSLSMQH